MKLLHLADVHLDRKARRFGGFAGTLREAIERAFEKALRLGAERGAQAVLVAGDLFDSAPTKKRLRWLFRAVEELQIPFIVLPGTHGHDRSVYESAAFRHAPSNFHILRGSGSRPFDPPGLRVSYNVERPLEFPAPAAEFPTIGIAHGSVDVPSDEAEVFGSSDIARSGVSYLALGHWHGTKDVSSGGVAAWYAGPPEALEWNGEKGGALLVELEDLIVERLEVGRYRWVALELDAGLVGEKGLREELLRRAGEDSVVRAELRGGGVEEELARGVERELSGSFAFLRLTARPWRASAAAFVEGTVGWHFVELLREELASAAGEEKDVLQEAIELGKKLLAGEEDLP